MTGRVWVVTLRVITEEGNPRKWDWSDLIGDDCSVVSVVDGGAA